MRDRRLPEGFERAGAWCKESAGVMMELQSAFAVSPEVVWGLVPRFVGLIYLIAFGTVAPQVLQLGGSGGHSPVQGLLSAVRRDYPGVRRYFEYPTVLWWLRSDGWLRALPYLGVGCALLAMYGDQLGMVGLVACWVLWLSLEPLGLIFPWDTMLQEVGFLVLFLPPVLPLPELATSALPLPTVAFMMQWLVLRLMLGFGKDKFIGVQADDALYLRGFFVWMPLPTPAGWYAHHSPAWLLKMAHGLMFVAEIVAPIMGLFAGWPRLLSYLLMTGLMVGVQLTGNWGFFNLAYILLCTSLLDLHSSPFDVARSPWVEHFYAWPDLAVHICMAGLFLVSLFYLPLNSWFTRSWVHWPSNFMAWKTAKLRHVLLKLHRLLEPLRRIAPFRLVNGYGVFPPNSTPPLRIIPVFEGSYDGQVWRAYGYQRMPTRAEERPPFLAPSHARLDQSTYYFGNGIHSANLIGSALPYSSPHCSHARASFFDVMVQALLAGDPLHVGALGHNPFPEAPPRWIRVGVLAMTPTRPREMRATGYYWHVRRLGTLVPARGKEDWPRALQFPLPETFHPDYVEHKRRSWALRAVLAAHRSGLDLDRAVIAESDLSVADVRMFWQELVPLLNHDRGDWERIHARAGAIHERFDVMGLYRMERILERYVWVLRETVAGHPAAEAATEALQLTNFRQHLILQGCVARGRALVEEILADPMRFVAVAAQETDETQLWVLGLIRYEQMIAHACGFRWCEVGLRAHELQIPGLFEFYPLLSRLQPPAEDFCPHPVKHQDGEYSIDDFYPPPSVRVAAEP